MKRIIQFGIGCMLALFTLVIGCFLIVNISAHRYLVRDFSKIQTSEAAIVPGAAIYSDGRLSPIFSDRLDAAVVLYKDGLVSKILVSGDNSSTTYNEVNPARRYLLSKNIPDADIFLDHAGFDTYSTMYRAQYIFKVSSAVVVTQSFHLPRSLFIAHALGIEVYGVRASNKNASTYNFVRELFADVKAVLDVLTHTTPKYLGTAIPITGDGRNYQ